MVLPPGQAGKTQLTGLQPADSHFCHVSTSFHSMGHWEMAPYSRFLLPFEGWPCLPLLFSKTRYPWAWRRRADLCMCWRTASHLETGMLLCSSAAQDCHREMRSHWSKLPDKRKGQPRTQHTQSAGPNFSSALGSVCQDEMHQERYHFAKS